MRDEKYIIILSIYTRARESIFINVYRDDTGYVLQDDLKNCFSISIYNIILLFE